MQNMDNGYNFQNVASNNGYHDQNKVPSFGALDVDNRVGDCHIFNFMEYDSSMRLGKREGSQEDVKELKKVFSALDFNVKNHKESLPAQDTLDAINKAARETSRGKYFVCCIMTHGNEKDQVATYNRWLYLEDILDKCSHIFGRNQIIFIVQACRSKKLKLEKLQIKESTDFGQDTTYYSEVLVARSTYSDTVSMRTDYGTYFIQEVCHALKYLSGNLNLFEVLTVVNFKMANFFKTCIAGEIGGQMPVFYSTLTSEIMFNARSGPTEPYVESLLGRKLIANGCTNSLDLNHISNLKYDIKPENIKFFGIHIKLDSLPELKNAAASLSRALKKHDYPRIKPCEVSRNKEVKKKIEESAKESADCVFYLISGPSSYGSLCDAKGKKIYQRKVIEYFVEKQNSHLVSKPKIFLFLMFEPVSKPPVESKETGESCDGEEPCLIAQHADILEIQIVVKSKNDKDIFKPVNAMVKQLKASSDPQDFLSMLTKVNSALVQENFLDNENNFHFNSTLTKKLVLP